jgi:hypothetical protein
MKLMPRAAAVITALSKAEAAVGRALWIDEALIAIAEMPIRGSAIAYALHDESVWNSGMRECITAAARGDLNALKVVSFGSRIGIPVFGLDTGAQGLAQREGSSAVRESHLVGILVSNPDCFAYTDVRAGKLIERVTALEPQWEEEETPETDVVHDIAEELDLLN